MSIEEMAERAPDAEAAAPSGSRADSGARSSAGPEAEVEAGSGSSSRRPPSRFSIGGWRQLAGGPAAIWIGSRLALMVYLVVACQLMGIDQQVARTSRVQWFLDRLNWWDSGHFLRIARLGYPPNTCCDQAFFPGYPALIRIGTLLTGGDYRASAVLVTFLAGTVAAVLIWRLALVQAAAAGKDTSEGIRIARRATLYLTVAPYGIFLTAAYTEALFLACALAAWLAGSRRRWWWAGLFAAAACVIRLNGIFLVVALTVMYLLQAREDGRSPLRRDALWLSLPIAALGGFVVWLHSSTGSWNAWQEAEIKGWQREKAEPWTGLKIGWRAVVDPIARGHWDGTISPGLDLLATLAGLGLIIVFVLRRRWPEAVYMTLNVVALICSTTLVSSARYAVTWFPAYLLIAAFTARPRWRWLHPVILICCVPLLAYFSLTFARHGWVD